MQVHGHLAALLWVWTAIALFVVLMGMGLATTLMKAVVQYLTTARVHLNANLNSTTQDEMKAMLYNLGRMGKTED